MSVRKRMIRSSISCLGGTGYAWDITMGPFRVLLFIPCLCAMYFAGHLSAKTSHSITSAIVFFVLGASLFLLSGFTMKSGILFCHRCEKDD